MWSEIKSVTVESLAFLNRFWCKLHLDQFVVDNFLWYFHAFGGLRRSQSLGYDDAKEGKQKVTTLHISISLHVIKWRLAYGPS